MIAPARRAAVEVLRAVSRSDATLPDALARTAGALTDERDRHLAAEIATGTLRMRAALDHRVAALARRPLSALEPAVLDVLRATAYQLIHLDRLPAHAVVNDAVALTRSLGGTSAAGFVNAVARRLADPATRPGLPARPAASLPPGPVREAGAEAGAWLEYLAVTLSHPRWLAERLLERLGSEDAGAWCAFDNARAPLTLRANTLRIDRIALAARLADRGVTTLPTPWAPEGLVVTGGAALGTPEAEEGLLVAQDEASQVVAALAAAQPGEAVLDTCAAPGGKTLALAGSLAGRGRLVAMDLRPRRVALLARTATLAAPHRVHVVRADLAVGPPVRPVFDLVLLDAPCSGLGTIRREPEVRWRRQPADLARFASQQGRLADAAARAVRPGGRLVYATCSSEPEENDDVVEAFLARTPSFVLEDARPAAAGAPWAAVLDARGCLRTSPARHGLEAFFAAVLRRRF
jgi:16S rRNA (cytosine967-C5)-methyltransferase